MSEGKAYHFETLQLHVGQEQPQKEKSVRKRLERAKENMETRDNGKLKNKPKGREMER